MSDLSKMPVIAVTGFLGAENITLISHLIRNTGDRTVALVLNEFGAFVVGGDILQTCAIPDGSAGTIIELANGFICCNRGGRFHSHDREARAARSALRSPPHRSIRVGATRATAQSVRLAADPQPDHRGRRLAPDFIALQATGLWRTRRISSLPALREDWV